MYQMCINIVLVYNLSSDLILYLDINYNHFDDEQRCTPHDPGIFVSSEHLDLQEFSPDSPQ